MTQMLLTTAALIALLASLAALAGFARRDCFAGPGTAYRRADELGTFGIRRRQR